jgi:hypothetical protein
MTTAPTRINGVDTSNGTCVVHYWTITTVHIPQVTSLGNLAIRYLERISNTMGLALTLPQTREHRQGFRDGVDGYRDGAILTEKPPHKDDGWWYWYREGMSFGRWLMRA